MLAINLSGSGTGHPAASTACVSAYRYRWILSPAHAKAYAQKAPNCRAIAVSQWKSSTVGDQTNGSISTDISKLLQAKMTATQVQEKGREEVGMGHKQHGGASWCYGGPRRPHGWPLRQEEKGAVSPGAKQRWTRVLPLPKSFGPCYLEGDGNGWKRFSSPTSVLVHSHRSPSTASGLDTMRRHRDESCPSGHFFGPVT